MPQRIITNDRLRCLRRILREWIALNNRLGCEWRKAGDAPWWHIERALVSLFAGAVWRCGGDAFEEYAEDKRGERTRASGRVDLWFSYRKKEFKVEAKQCWVRSDKRTKARNEILDSMKLAQRDAGNLRRDGMRYLAMVFGVVYTPERLGKELTSQIKSIEDLVTDKSIKADAVAWVFPKLKRSLVSADNFILPGIIVWIKEVQRSRTK